MTISFIFTVIYNGVVANTTMPAYAEASADRLDFKLI